MKIAYVTDSGTGFSIDEMAKEQIFSLPLQISVNGKNYFDLEQISVGDVINYLKEDATMATSQPAIGLIENLFDKLKSEGFDKVIAVPICSALSGTMNALYMAAQSHNMPITCVDTYVTAYVERYIIEYLKRGISDLGQNEEDVLKDVACIIDSCDTLLVPTDLNHLSKSGRMTPFALRLGTLLNIKPILRINKETNGKIDVIEKVRTFKRALNHALEIMKKRIDSDDYIIHIVHVDNYGDAIAFKEQVAKSFPNNPITIDALCSPVAIHTGLGCIAIQYYRQLKK